METDNPRVASEIGFLERPSSPDTETAAAGDDVGRIDHVLVHPTVDPIRWCALEIQAVYFSGASMNADFTTLRHHQSQGLPFPAGHRRPDFRSSGPKRLMPQLQIKVPSLRRWGKKMAVVVDEAFFSALGHMDTMAHISNGDIVWFVVNYEETESGYLLREGPMYVTTLERSVEGLTGGTPVSLPIFEDRIRTKLAVRASQKASLDLSQ